MKHTSDNSSKRPDQPLNAVVEEDDDDIVELLEVVTPGKSVKVGAGESGEADFSADLEAMLDEVSAKEAKKNDTDPAFPDPTPVDHTVDADEELAMPGLGDVDSLLKTLGASETAKSPAAGPGVGADTDDAAPLGGKIGDKNGQPPAVPVDLDDLPLPKPRKETAPKEPVPVKEADPPALREPSPVMVLDLNELPPPAPRQEAEPAAVPLDLEDLAGPPFGKKIDPAAAPAGLAESSSAQAAKAAVDPFEAALAETQEQDETANAPAETAAAPFEAAKPAFSEETEEADSYMSGLDNLLNDILATAPASGRKASAAPTPPPPPAAPAPPPAPAPAQAAPESKSAEAQFDADYEEFAEEFRDELDSVRAGVAEIRMLQEELAKRIPIVPHDKIDDLLLRLDELEVFTKDQTFRIDTLKAEAAEKTAELGRRLDESLVRNDGLSKEMKGLRSDDLHPRLESLEQSIQDQVKRIDSLKAELSERATTFNRRLEDSRQHNESLTKELEGLLAKQSDQSPLQKRLEKLEQAAREQTGRVEVLKGEVADLNRRQEEARQREEALGKEMKGLRTDDLHPLLQNLEQSSKEHAGQIESLTAEAAGHVALIESVKAHAAQKTAELAGRLDESFKRHDALSGELEKLRVDNGLRRRLDTLEQTGLEHAELLESLTSETALQVGLIEALKVETTEHKNLIASIKTESAGYADRIESVKAEAAEKAAELDRRLEEVLKRHSDLSAELASLRADEALQQRLETLELSDLDRAGALESLKAETATHADFIEALKAETAAQAGLIESVKTESAKRTAELGRRLEESRKRNESLGGELENLRADDGLQQRLDAVEQSTLEQAGTIETLKAEAAEKIAELGNRLEEALQRNDILGDELEKLRVNDKLQQRIEALERMAREQSGRINSVKVEGAEQISDLSRHLEEALQRNETLSKELQELRANDGMQLRLEEVEQSAQEQAEQIDLVKGDVAEKVRSLRRLLDESRQRNDTMTKEMRDLRAHVTALQANMEKLAAQAAAEVIREELAAILQGGSA